MKALIWIARLTCLLVAVWSIYGFGRPTLVEILEYNFGLSLTGAAAIVSVLVAVSGTVSLIPGMMKLSTQDGDPQL